MRVAVQSLTAIGASPNTKLEYEITTFINCPAWFDPSSSLYYPAGSCHVQDPVTVVRCVVTQLCVALQQIQ